MHILGVVFLWANRLFFTVTLFSGLSHWRSPRNLADRNDGIAKTSVSLWQIAGTFIFMAREASPFHLLWWYPLGWGVYVVINLLVGAVRLGRVE